MCLSTRSNNLLGSPSLRELALALVQLVTQTLFVVLPILSFNIPFLPNFLALGLAHAPESHCTQKDTHSTHDIARMTSIGSSPNKHLNSPKYVLKMGTPGLLTPLLSPTAPVWLTAGMSSFFALENDGMAWPLLDLLLQEPLGKLLLPDFHSRCLVDP